MMLYHGHPAKSAFVKVGFLEVFPEYLLESAHCVRMGYARSVYVRDIETGRDFNVWCDPFSRICMCTTLEGFDYSIVVQVHDDESISQVFDPIWIEGIMNAA